MKFAKPLAALFLLLSLFSGSPAFAQSDDPSCDLFYAGQTIVAGQVCVTVDADKVIIDYLLEGGWTLSEAHAWIGDSMSSMPQNKKGNPQIGRFPQSASGLGSLTHYSFTVPVSALNVNADTFCEAEIFVAAHGVVAQTSSSSGKKGSGTESAWAGATQLSVGGSWARVFSFNNDFCGGGQDPDPEEPEEPEEPENPPVVTYPAGCYNVFGQGQTAFSPVGVTDNSTGWIYTLHAAYRGYVAPLVNGSNQVVGRVTGWLPGNGTLELYYSLDSVMNGFHSVNAYAGAVGSFVNVSPLQYGTSMQGGGAPVVVLPLYNQIDPILDIVAHAVVCPAGVVN
ncbi:MAG: hypothetical protein Q8L60_14030 [Gammaproteobacteria bacterium]|nr:hypothetical protein [Gammaproteobacteria bacterium]MDP2142130.1 hypothetical protein [Gammaproteobacteria bacterium]MDP2348262.1 hypothetical protein [Gammaproteobacteria bacterium]